MTVGVWTLVAVAWVALFAGCVAGWRLRGSVQQRRRGGMLDLTPAAGELELDWSDARPEIRYDYRPEALSEYHALPVFTHEVAERFVQEKTMRALVDDPRAFA